MAAHPDRSRPGMMLKGSSDSLGANWVGTGVNFALYSDRASAVELCLFANDGEATARFELPECTDGVWHGFLPDCQPGQHYGYRVHGEFAPDKGLYFNAHKLLLDPYARQLSGPLIWDASLHAQQTSGSVRGKYQPNLQDSAEYMPKGVVVGPAKTLLRPRPVIAWEDTLLYELNVRGYTMRHPAVAEIDRGRFSGLAVKEVLAYLKALGVTAVELMPCHAFTDEHFLIE
ncbi:MAG: glycogen debranching enzyme GlgX, partial [Gammaproteobacteria bacterium]|nr:glycogen debranching enzyme GlgX [Gammaproteobacteria bacterium]